MKVTLVQMDIKWGDIAANSNAASHFIDSQPGSDVYVLPEMFSTGFATEPEKIADSNNISLAWMQQKAIETNAAVCGSVASVVEDGTYRNRMYFVTPDLVTYYDKHHLFSYGHETDHYTAGNDRVIVEWRGVRFLLQVCYDLRFPCFSRNKAAAPQAPQMGECLKHDLDVEDHSNEQNILSHPYMGGAWGPVACCTYDGIIYVASWPTSRIRVWNTLLQARALENQCYVLGVNRIGSDPACQYCGGTQCVDAYGRVVAACDDNTAQTITVDLDMDRLMAFRKKFPVLLDADR